MPYESVKDLPADVKKRFKGAKLRQWMHVFNSEMEAGKAESIAFAAANAVAGKKELTWDDIYLVRDRQLTQDQAGYNPVGGNNEKACANCNWYVPSRDACVIVAGDIVSNGVSDFWEAKAEYVMQPIPVTIVGGANEDKTSTGNKSLWERVVSFFNRTPAAGSGPVQPQSAIYFHRKDNEPTRFFIWASNQFEDKDGEIFTEASHKEFIEWCDENNTYPEFWLWHAAGSKAGDVDFLDYVDGFLVVSGTLLPEYERIVNALDGQDIRASHGYLARYKGKEVLQYRSWEVSALPGWAACNPWTAYASIKEEGEMGFSAKKKDWLKSVAGVDEAQIATWEQNTAQAAENLKSLGISFKGDDGEEETESAGEKGDDTQAKMIASIMQTQMETTSALKELATKINEMQRTDDEKIAAAIKAEVEKMPRGFKPTESEQTATGAKEGEESNSEKDAWFADLVGVKRA